MCKCLRPVGAELLMQATNSSSDQVHTDQDDVHINNDQVKTNKHTDVRTSLVRKMMLTRMMTEPTHAGCVSAHAQQSSNPMHTPLW